MLHKNRSLVTVINGGWAIGNDQVFFFFIIVTITFAPILMSQQPLQTFLLLRKQPATPDTHLHLYYKRGIHSKAVKKASSDECMIHFLRASLYLFLFEEQSYCALSLYKRQVKWSYSSLIYLIRLSCDSCIAGIRSHSFCEWKESDQPVVPQHTQGQADFKALHQHVHSSSPKAYLPSVHSLLLSGLLSDAQGTPERGSASAWTCKHKKMKSHSVSLPCH